MYVCVCAVDQEAFFPSRSLSLALLFLLKTFYAAFMRVHNNNNIINVVIYTNAGEGARSRLPVCNG